MTFQAERNSGRNIKMLNEIPVAVRKQMEELERIDARDRTDGTPRMKRLRQIPPEVGKFIAILAAMAPKGRWIEIGTSAGYSTLWLALACRTKSHQITTYEILEEKAQLARRTFAAADVNDVVELVQRDALDHLRNGNEIAFCFLDAEKEVYAQCYEAVVPLMVSGGIIVADNAINHRATLQPMLDRALSDDRVDALIVPIGKGELVCRRK
jgi:predicted O-methyltransferase YrrM